MARDYRRENLKRRYGITPEEYDAILEAQGGGCYVCGSTENLIVDHAHGLIGRASVRGILDHACNLRVIPVVEHHEGLIKAALDYLIRPPAHQILVDLSHDGPPLNPET